MRLSRYSKVELTEFKDEGSLLAAISAKGVSILLDEAGESFTSVKFARLIERQMVSGTQLLNFAIGGSSGWSEKVQGGSSLKLSLSALTFPHQMVRLILLEQLYRAFTIIRGEPYHKQ